ncbi:MAG: hypothetical protein ACK5L5_08970 [Bacteroidales bacterium]
MKINVQNITLPKAEGFNAPKIEEMYWMDCDGNRIESTKENDQVELYIKVSNAEEGEELTINIDDDKGARTTLIGALCRMWWVDFNGKSLLSAKIKFSQYIFRNFHIINVRYPSFQK